MTSSRRVWLVTAALTLVVGLGVGAVAVFVPGSSVEGTAVAAAPDGPPSAFDKGSEVVIAKDGKSQLTVPENWIKLPKAMVGDGYQLCYGSLFREQYVGVVTDVKQDFNGFDEYVSLVESERPDLDDWELISSEEIELNGLRAVRVHFTGTADGMRSAFWSVAVRGKKAYYEVLGWTLRSYQRGAEGPIREVMDTFQETANDSE